MTYDLLVNALPAASSAASSTISSSRVRYSHSNGNQLLYCRMNPAVHARLRLGYTCETMLPGQLGSGNWRCLPRTHARRKLGGNIKLSFRLGRQLLTAAKVRTTDVEKNKKVLE